MRSSFAGVLRWQRITALLQAYEAIEPGPARNRFGQLIAHHGGERGSSRAEL